MKIPKIIHYCWFGKGEKPELVNRCILSWMKILPDYEIIEWNEENFDISINTYAQEAYKVKKYAFVSDYVRLKVLYEYGGIYLDTDIEIIKSLDYFLKHNVFIGLEDDKIIGTGIIGAKKNNEWIKLLLDSYNDRKFISDKGDFDLTPNVSIITELTNNNYKIISDQNFKMFGDNMVIYSRDWFYPLAINGDEFFSNNTHTIHYYAGSWLDKKAKFRKKFVLKSKKIRDVFRRRFGEKNYNRMRNLLDIILK